MKKSEKAQGFARRYLDDKTYAHTKRIVESLLEDKHTSEMVISAAWLHDVVEDSNEISNSDVELAFGVVLAEIVFALTRGQKENYITYIRRVKKNEIASLIKLYDIVENMTRDDDPTLRASLRPRYRKALVELLMPSWQDT